jgi:hypothetical protein
MSHLRLAGVLIALTAVGAGAGLALGGGTSPPAPPPAPSITEFTCAPEGGLLWSFWGTVANPASVPNLRITFDGIPAINGLSAKVNPDGSFSLTLPVPLNQTGIVGAILVDANDTEYDEAETLVT